MVDSVTTTVSINILESCEDLENITGAGSPSLDWELVDKDNNDPECYLVGGSYLVRLTRSPDPLPPPPTNISVFGVNATVYYSSAEEKNVWDEYVVFDGKQVASLNSTLLRDFSYDIIGIAKSATGTVLPFITFSISPGSNKIVASVPCYAVLKVDYKARYYFYKFTGLSEGRAILIGNMEFGDDTITASQTVELWGDCDDRDRYYIDPETGERILIEDCLGIDIELDTSSERGADYSEEGKKLFRIYNVTQTQVYVNVTRGSLTYLGSKEGKREEELFVTNGKASPSNRAYSLISQIKTGGHINTLILTDDGTFKMLGTPGETFLNKNGVITNQVEEGAETVNGIPLGYGTVKVNYMARYLEYLVTSTSKGKGILFVQEKGNDDCDVTYTTYDFKEEEEEGEEFYDITLVYKDFVTGESIAEAKVWVDDKYIGQTNDSGEIEVKQVSSNVKHSAKASKSGYLTTDSDSLANDTFMIRDE